jgi:histidinol-phosphate/aromatic aminotransferase/cobyric acid decarboxylase-like protein
MTWCRDHERHARLFGRQENWGLSGVDVTVAAAAVREGWDWADDTRNRMHDDNRWLAEMLAHVPKLDLRANSKCTFQYAFCEQAHALAETMRRHGIGVRVLSRAHGVTPDALRIVAPRADEREQFAAALAAAISN